MSDVREAVEYRIGRSEAAFKMATIAAREEDWNHVCNRLYYAVFYVVSAYLPSGNVDVKTHNGVRIKFHQVFVKTELLGTVYGELYDLLFNNRQEADYSDFLIFSKEEIFPLIEETKGLLILI